MTAYAELQVTSNFTFLEGASHPHELVARAAELGHRAMAITDRNSLAGVVRAHVAVRQAAVRLVIGARLEPGDGPGALCLPTDRHAYSRLSRLITLGRRRAGKGRCTLSWSDIEAHADGQILIVLPAEDGLPGHAFAGELMHIAEYCPQVFLGASCRFDGRDRERLAMLDELGRTAGTPMVATNDVRYHHADRRPLADVLTSIREHCTIDEAGLRLAANAERCLKGPGEMAALFEGYPEALEQSVGIAESCRFDLDELTYEYPGEIVPNGETPQSCLARLVAEGAHRRYGPFVPPKVQDRLDHELVLIERLAYAPYFLSVYDIVRHAREQGILCQGRGSAANSAVCYCLGITAVDPDRHDLLFERFVSMARNEPPDIDVDFEHERREDVIQYIYAKYGRERAALTAVVICYRGRSAIREVGKALGLSADITGILTSEIRGHPDIIPKDAQLRALGLDPGDRRIRLTLELAVTLIGFPRHLSQHVGGFVITREALSDIVPIENAAMDGRTVIEWNKDDIDALGMLKVDVLGLGMLTCIRKSFDLIALNLGRRLDLGNLPAEDPLVYDMLCRGDSLGVFQVESRAQMSMLPRLKPRSFYDLVIEVAIVRPGPIQGDMVHPFLRRRRGDEPVTYPSPELEQVLGKTLGVPLFQEQAMRIAMVAGGFTPDEADRLRRAMATFRHTGTVGDFRDRLVEGMVARGYERAFAERCFTQIEGFGEYGFPEAHAASFALLVYVSAWLKCHHPAAFAAALLNSQPMGFYAPAQIVRDARDHGVTVHPPDINYSEWDCTMETDAASTGGFALRLGLRQIRGFREGDATRLVAARANGYDSPMTLSRRTGLAAAALDRLARADTFGSLGLGRREALWTIKGLAEPCLPLFADIETPGDDPCELPPASAGEEVVEDYASLRLSLKAHPLLLLREALTARGIIRSAALVEIDAGSRVSVCGLVLVRQRPGSAKGMTFATIEDESGVANIVILPPVFERFRRPVLASRLLEVRGRLQREETVIHVVAEHLTDLSPMLSRLVDGEEGGAPLSTARSRDFH